MIRERKRADGTTQGWQARVNDPADPKRKRRIEKTFRLKKDAQAWEREQRYLMGKGGYIDPRKADATFTTLVDAWREKRYPTLAPRSRARYDQVCRTHLLPAFGHMPVSAVTKDAVRRYFGGLTEASNAGLIAPATVRKIHTTLSAVFSEAVDAGVVAVNPATRVPLPRVPDHEMHFLTDAEARALADAMPTPSDRLLVLTAAYTGLRASELHALRVRDVDLLHGRLRVERAIKSWEDGTPTYGATKSGKGRVVPLAPWLRAELTAHLAQGGANRASGPDALVFRAQGRANAEQRAANPDRAIHQVAWLRNHYKPTVREALPDRSDYANKRGLRFHDLRHSYASFLIARGAHLEAVRTLLGHASIVTTQRYAHLAPDVYDALASSLGGDPAAAPAGASTVVAIGG